MTESGRMGRVLIVDDEPNALKVLSAILSEDGYSVLESPDAESAVKIIRNADLDAIITDVKMPGKDGMQLFEYLHDNHPDLPVIFLTAYGTVESAVQTMTRGAFYYFIKPPDYHRLKAILSRAVEQRRLKRGLEDLRKQVQNGTVPSRFTGNTPEMARIFRIIETVKDAASNVLISGETGTGKELIARALHYGSVRKDMPFVTVNCAAIPGDLMESELFGFEKGAFTGALFRRIGRFEEASGGTVFLDEIGELELSLQAKLLRVLQEREIERIGSSNKIKVDFRLVSSTNRDLEKEVAQGNFREDLFYRINVVWITVPPLRDRTGDIPLLVPEFVNEFCLRENKVLTVSEEVMDAFLRHPWPGNVRQLRNVIERAVVLAKGSKITARDLPEELIPAVHDAPQGFTRSTKTLREMEAQAIKDALRECKGNKSKVATVLGISRKALYKRLKEFHLT